jgi:hypothetical protein
MKRMVIQEQNLEPAEFTPLTSPAFDRTRLVNTLLTGNSRDGRSPYEHVVRSLQKEWRQRECKAALASALAEICRDYLSDRLDEIMPELVPELMRNVFSLAGQLSEPDQLWEPLFAVYRAMSVRHLPEGHSLVVASPLRDGLALNQGTSELREEWLGIIRGSRSVLPGNERSGFTGILNLPERGGKAWWNSLCEALSILADRFSHEPARFESFVRRARDFWPEPEFDRKMCEFAFDGNWPEDLLELVVYPGFYYKSAANVRYLSDALLQSIPSRDTESAYQWSERLGISVYTQSSDYLDVAGPVFEYVMRNYVSERQPSLRLQKHILSHILPEIPSDAETVTSPTFQQASDELLRQLRIDPEEPESGTGAAVYLRPGMGATAYQEIQARVS